jgi:hypothetical protein
MLVADFFHIDCRNHRKQIYVFFALEVGRRYVHILGTPCGPSSRSTARLTTAGGHIERCNFARHAPIISP